MTKGISISISTPISTSVSQIKRNVLSLKKKQVLLISQGPVRRQKPYKSF